MRRLFFDDGGPRPGPFVALFTAFVVALTVLLLWGISVGRDNDCREMCDAIGSEVSQRNDYGCLCADGVE